MSESQSKKESGYILEPFVLKPFYGKMAQAWIRKSVFPKKNKICWELGRKRWSLLVGEWALACLLGMLPSVSTVRNDPNAYIGEVCT